MRKIFVISLLSLTTCQPATSPTIISTEGDCLVYKQIVADNAAQWLDLKLQYPKVYRQIQEHDDIFKQRCNPEKQGLY